jgi:hypothetical protein
LLRASARPIVNLEYGVHLVYFHGSVSGQNTLDDMGDLLEPDATFEERVDGYLIGSI